jgi:hypothetical protein
MRFAKSCSSADKCQYLMSDQADLEFVAIRNPRVDFRRDLLVQNIRYSRWAKHPQLALQIARFCRRIELLE